MVWAIVSNFFCLFDDFTYSFFFFLIYTQNKNKNNNNIRVHIGCNFHSYLMYICIFICNSSLSGNNGSWTNTDDVDHAQRVRNNREAHNHLHQRPRDLPVAVVQPLHCRMCNVQLHDIIRPKPALFALNKKIRWTCDCHTCAQCFTVTANETMVRMGRRMPGIKCNLHPDVVTYVPLDRILDANTNLSILPDHIVPYWDNPQYEINRVAQELRRNRERAPVPHNVPPQVIPIRALPRNVDPPPPPVVHLEARGEPAPELAGEEPEVQVIPVPEGDVVVDNAPVIVPPPPMPILQMYHYPGVPWAEVDPDIIPYLEVIYVSLYVNKPVLSQHWFSDIMKVYTMRLETCYTLARAAIVSGISVYALKFMLLACARMKYPPSMRKYVVLCAITGTCYSIKYIGNFMSCILNSFSQFKQPDLETLGDLQNFYPEITQIDPEHPIGVLGALGYHYIQEDVQIYPRVRDAVMDEFAGSRVNSDTCRFIFAAVKRFVTTLHAPQHFTTRRLHNTAHFLTQELQLMRQREVRGILTPVEVGIPSLRF